MYNWMHTWKPNCPTKGTWCVWFTSHDRKAKTGKSQKLVRNTGVTHLLMVSISFLSINLVKCTKKLPLCTLLLPVRMNPSYNITSREEQYW